MRGYRRMEWLANNGEIYHSTCVRWTASLEAGKCEQCGEEIPDTMLRLAHSQRDQIRSEVRDRQVVSLHSVTQRFIEMRAKTKVSLRRAHDGQKPGEKKG